MRLVDKLWPVRGQWIPRKVRSQVYAVIQTLGLDNHTFAEDLAHDLARELGGLAIEERKAFYARIQELLEANNREVERRRLAERVIGQIGSFIRSQDCCNPGTPYAPGLDVIFKSTGYSPT